MFLLSPDLFEGVGKLMSVKTENSGEDCFLLAYHENIDPQNVLMNKNSTYLDICEHIKDGMNK